MFCWYRYFVGINIECVVMEAQQCVFSPYCSKQKAIIMRMHCCAACVAFNIAHVDCVAKGMQQCALVSILCCVQIHVSLKSIYDALGSSFKLSNIFVRF